MSTCQHCGGAVEYGTTEQGHRGFVHTASGLAECPPAVSAAQNADSVPCPGSGESAVNRDGSTGECAVCGRRVSIRRNGTPTNLRPFPHRRAQNDGSVSS